jgi:hypothetical protein
VVVDIVDVESRTKTYKNNDDVVKKLQEAFLATTTVSATTKQNIRFVTGSIGETLEIIRLDHPSVKYLYRVRDDLAFDEPIDHTGLVRTMEKSPSLKQKDYVVGGSQQHQRIVDYILFKYHNAEKYFLVHRQCKDKRRKVLVRKSKNTTRWFPMTNHTNTPLYANRACILQPPIIWYDSIGTTPSWRISGETTTTTTTTR